MSQNGVNSSWSGDGHLQSTISEGSGASIEYLAGYWDGEGCFSAKIPSETEPVEFTMSLSSTCERAVRMFDDRFGGSVSEREPENDSHSTYWSWRTSGRRARVAAESLKPHLHEKGEQCEVFIDALAYKAQRNTGTEYTGSEVERMHEFGEEVRGMNSGQRRFAGDSE